MYVFFCLTIIISSLMFLLISILYQNPARKHYCLQNMDESEHGSRETITLAGILGRSIDCVNLYRGKIQFRTPSEISQSVLLIGLLRCVKECRFSVDPLCIFT